MMALFKYFKRSNPLPLHEGPLSTRQPQKKLRDQQIPLQNGTTAALRHFKTLKSTDTHNS